MLESLKFCVLYVLYYHVLCRTQLNVNKEIKTEIEIFAFF